MRDCAGCRDFLHSYLLTYIGAYLSYLVYPWAGGLSGILGTYVGAKKSKRKRRPHEDEKLPADDALR